MDKNKIRNLLIDYENKVGHCDLAEATKFVDNFLDDNWDYFSEKHQLNNK
jgi:hypothetical protein